MGAASPPSAISSPTTVGRMPLPAFRETLPPKYREMPDEEILALRDQLYDLADLVLEVALVGGKEITR